MNWLQVQGNQPTMYLNEIYSYMYVCVIYVYRGICNSKDSIEVHKELDCFFQPFANVYMNICHQQIKARNEFFGLRDFYR